jgi:hypothetical protein
MRIRNTDVIDADLDPEWCKSRSESTTLVLIIPVCLLGEACVNSAKLETNMSWLPPGFIAPLEKKVLDLDSRLPSLITDVKKRRNLSVGAILSYLAPADLDRLVLGNEVGSVGLNSW